MSLHTQKIFSSLFKIPDFKNRHYPTFFMGISVINAIAGVCWWTTQSILLLIVPLSVFFGINYAKKFRYLSLFTFFGMALYCSILYHNYRNLQEYLLGQSCSGIAVINEIHYQEPKDLYRIDAIFTRCQTTEKLRVQFFIKEKPILEKNDQIYLENISFKEPQNESYKLYLLKESIHATAFSQRLIFNLQAKNRSFAQLFTHKLQHLEKQIYKKLSKNSQVLFGSLFLGSKKYMEDPVLKNHFNTWGINHFLARSGLHVSIIIFLILFISRICQLTFFASTFMTLFSLIFYTFFSYSSISFFRALVSSFFVLWSFMFKVPINLLHILLITLMLFILYNPFYLFFLDFQLTFLLTFGLCIVTLINSEA